jgi:excisionase family DNA binding protein
LALIATLPRVRDPRYPERVERIKVDLDKDWLAVADICEYMDVSPFVVTRVLRSGELPAVKMGREWRISRVDFEDWLNAQRLASLLSDRKTS